MISANPTLSDFLSLKQDFHELNLQKVAGLVANRNKNVGNWLFQKPYIKITAEWQKILYDNAFDDWQPSFYAELFNKYIKMQIKATDSEIEELMQKTDDDSIFRLQCILERDNEIDLMFKKIDGLVEGYVSDWLYSAMIDKEKFKNTCKSFVTQFLFQTPNIKCSSKEQREIYFEVMRMWNPNYFVTELCERLNKVFEML